VIVTDLSFLVAPGVQRDQIAEIAVGSIGDAERLTGVDGGIYIYCARPEMIGCTDRLTFQLYRAMTGAAIEIDRLVMSAQTSALPGGLPRTPLPPVDPSRQSTLSEPISTGFIWTTEDVALPDPG
jgi:hypothetical protein